MRVHLVKEVTLKEYARENARFRSIVRHWLSKIKCADWRAPENILQDFSSADLLANGSGRVVFDLGGNNCRMICKYYFGRKVVHLYICWVGTHREYDEICRKGLQFTIIDY